MFDLPNNNVRVNGSVRIIDFNIKSETMLNGRRTLSLKGVDYEGNRYSATGTFLRENGGYKLNVTNLKNLMNVLVTENDIEIITEDGQEILLT